MDENSFYSIDRLVEFGLTLGVATQMANSMNASLQAMQIPGARNPCSPTRSRRTAAPLRGPRRQVRGPARHLRTLTPHRREARDQGDLRLEAWHVRLATRGECAGGAQARRARSSAIAKGCLAFLMRSDYFVVAGYLGPDIVVRETFLSTK